MIADALPLALYGVDERHVDAIHVVSPRIHLRGNGRWHSWPLYSDTHVGAGWFLVVELLRPTACAGAMAILAEVVKTPTPDRLFPWSEIVAVPDALRPVPWIEIVQGARVIRPDYPEGVGAVLASHHETEVVGRYMEARRAGWCPPLCAPSVSKRGVPVEEVSPELARLKARLLAEELVEAVGVAAAAEVIADVIASAG